MCEFSAMWNDREGARGGRQEAVGALLGVHKDGTIDERK
jgi:hypothetical protein